MPICATCSKSYVRAEHLKRHREAAHPHEFRLEGNQAPRRFHCDEPGCGRVFSRSDVLVRHRRSHIKDEPQTDASGATPSSSKRQRSSTSASTGSAPTGVETSLSADLPAVASTSSMMQHHDHHNNSAKRKSSFDQMDGVMPSPSHRHMHSIQDLLSPSSSMTSARPMEAAPQPQTQPPPQVVHHHHMHPQAPPQHQPPPMAPPTTAPPMPFDGGHWHAPPTMPSEAAAPGYPSPDIFGNAQQQQQQMTSFDLFAGAGAAGGWSSNTLTGLDWIFDDQCDSASNTDSSVISRFMTGFHGDDDHRAGDWQIFGPSPPIDRIGEMLGTAGRGHGTTTESINLLNLANAAAASRSGEGAAQPQKPRSEEDGADAWPQEFRPQRSKPSIIEISDYSLDIEEQHHVNDLEAWLAAATATPRRGSPGGGNNGGNGDRPIVVIDEAGDATRANSRRASESPNGSGLFGSTPSRWRVNEETRLQLLSYLQHSCRHPWSIYSFSKTPPTFLTCGQMELLISLCFRKFMAYCPILHPSSFDPSTAPPVLLLVTLTIGLVFYASEVQMHIGLRADRKDALSQLRKSAGVLSLAFSELVRIGVMSGYEADQTAWTNVELNQAWTIQQMFGIGSGDNRLYKLAERNRGGLITAIRRSGFFHTTDLRIDGNALAEMNAAQLDRTWKAWIEAEKRVRLGWFVFLYDQLFACFLDISPMLAYTEISSPFPCEERLWNAADATEWARRYRATRGFAKSGSDRDSTPSSSSTASSSSQMPFLQTLRQLLSPPQRRQDAQLRVSRLEAYILSVTLYRICWEAQKQSILFENDGGLEIDASCLDHRLNVAASRALKYLADSASRATSVVKSRAPPPSSSDSHLSLALSIDVHLLSLLAKLHFTGPPALFQKLRDAAGRSGWYTPRRKDALAWLETWMGRPPNEFAMKSMLVASAQVFDLIRSSLNSTVAKPDVLVIQSNICVISLFHASLYVWAYVKLSNSRRAGGGGGEHNGGGSSEARHSSATRDPTTLPRLSPTKISHVESTGYIDLVPNPYEALSAEGMDFAEPWEHHLSWEDDHEKLVTAWLEGAYVSTLDGEVKEWAAGGLTPRVVGIGELIAPAQQRGHGGGSSVPSTSAGVGPSGASSSSAAIIAAASRSVKASHVLQRFASLLRRLDWGLASTLSAILLLMARREAKSEVAAGGGIGGGGSRATS